MTQTISLMQGLLAMQNVLIYNYRKKSSDDIASLCGDLEIRCGGGTADPAAWNDWMRAIQATQGKVLETLTWEQGFDAMRAFLEGYYSRTTSEDVAVLLEEMKKLDNGEFANPNIYNQWLNGLAEALKKPTETWYCESCKQQ